MKPHIIVKIIDESSALSDIPHWEMLIRDKSLSTERIHPQIDAILGKYKLPFWAASEYKPKSNVWSKPEIDSGLNQFFRLVLRTNSRIPSEIIKGISLVPGVAEARFGKVEAFEMFPTFSPALSVNTNYAARDSIFLKEAHRYTKGNPNVTIAVLDTGVNQSHPEIRNVLDQGKDFVDIIDGATTFFGDYLDADEDPEDEVGHGTHVAGIIAGQGLKMPMGVVPKCKILPVRVLAAMKRGEQKIGAGLVENINAGVKWAIDNGADIINMSLGVKHSGGGLPHREVVDYAEKMGTTVVAASGNDGREESYYPGALPHVIAVGAMGISGNIAQFSTYGRQVSFVAPGEEIYSSYLDNDYAFASGTSHAAPFVSGAVAMLKSHARSKSKRLSDHQVKYILKNSSDKIGREFKDQKAGYGVLNLVDSLRLLDYKLN